MTNLIQLRRKSQITIPNKIRKVLGLEEGDYLQAELQNNKIILSPKIMLDKLPSVTLSKKGEMILNDGLRDIKENQIKKFDDVESAIKSLYK